MRPLNQTGRASAAMWAYSGSGRTACPACAAYLGTVL